MAAAMSRAWHADNQRYVMAGLAALAEALRRHIEPAESESGEPDGAAYLECVRRHATRA